MDALGKKLNLQPHDVNSERMALCGDIEVHKCTFDTGNTQYYCLDTAHVFPPEYSTEKPNSIFYEKLRPEFVGSYKTPLSSDSLTKFQENDPEAKNYNKAVVDATKDLHQNIIPSYLKELMKEKTIEAILSTTNPYYTLSWSPRENIPNALIYHMHTHGINLRHLGKIITLLETLNPKDANCSPEMLDRLKKYIYNAMITRVIKNHVRQEVREKITAEKEYRETLLNIVI